MSNPRWVRDLEAESGGKPVLLVEGKNDRPILAYFLTQLSSAWETQFVMLSAGSKERVINGIKNHHPEWAGIVDSDEWSLDDIQAELENVPRVKALPRFCLENYFCVPSEIWAALPAIQKEKINNDSGRLTMPILSVLPDWVAFGAMWRVMRRRYNRLLYE